MSFREDPYTNKKTLIQENEDLKFWLTYIQYRAHNFWAGRPSAYCTMDVDNILIRIKNDLIKYGNDTTLRRISFEEEQTNPKTQDDGNI
jgi:hypothetical protein